MAIIIHGWAKPDDPIYTERCIIGPVWCGRAMKNKENPPPTPDGSRPEERDGQPPPENGKNEG